MSKISPYYKVHDFFNFEEVNPSVLQIYSNIKSIDFCNSLPLVDKTLERNFARLDCFFPREYFVKDILFPDKLKGINLASSVLSLSSLKLKIKIMMEAEV